MKIGFEDEDADAFAAGYLHNRRPVDLAIACHCNGRTGHIINPVCSVKRADRIVAWHILNTDRDNALCVANNKRQGVSTRISKPLSVNVQRDALVEVGG